MLKEYESGQAPDGQPLRLVTLGNDQGFQVTLMDWGATWLSCQVPLQAGGTREVLLGCQTPMDYLRQNAYLGATVGPLRQPHSPGDAEPRWQAFYAFRQSGQASATRRAGRVSQPALAVGGARSDLRTIPAAFHRRRSGLSRQSGGGRALYRY